MRKLNTSLPITLILGLVAALGLPACSSDDDDGGAGPGDTNPEQNMMLSTVDAVVYPILRDLSVGPYLELLPNLGAAEKALQCQPLATCSSGSAQYCATTSGFRVEFSTCEAIGSVLDGSITFDGDASQGSGGLDLTIDGNPLSGTVGYTVSEGCVGQSFSELTAMVGSTSLTLSGYMEFCQPPLMMGELIIPHYAEFFIEFPGLSRFMWFTVFSEPQGTVEVSLWDSTTQQVLRVCHGTVYGNLSCASGDE
jgi:hypothetical protein